MLFLPGLQADFGGDEDARPTWGIPKKFRALLGDPYSKEHSVLGPDLGSLFMEPPHRDLQLAHVDDHGCCVAFKSCASAAFRHSWYSTR